MTAPDVNFEEPKISPKLMETCATLLTIFDDIDEKDHERDGESGPFNRRVVLVFLPGIWEIEEMQTILLSSKYANIKWDIVVLHSIITNEEQQRVFTSCPRGFRRIILSTNIAESSLTVPNVKYGIYIVVISFKFFA